MSDTEPQPFQWPEDMTPEERDAMCASVLAAVEGIEPKHQAAALKALAAAELATIGMDLDDLPPAA